MSQGRLQAAFERLISNGPAIVEGLRQAGYQSLASQTRRDVKALTWAIERGVWVFEEQPFVEEEWIGYPDEWSSGNIPEPPPNFVGEYWEANSEMRL